MRIHHFPLALLLVAGLLGMLCPGQEQPPQKKTKNHLGLVPTTLPAGVYKDAAVINQWIADNDLNKMQQHGWELWKATTAMTAQKVHGEVVPVFETWLDRDAALAAPNQAARPPHRLFKLPEQARVHGKAHDAGRLFAGVKYDPFLVGHLRKHKLYDPATLDQFRNKAMPPSPAHSVMVKAVYQIVAGDSPTKLGYWAGPLATTKPTKTPTPDTWKQLMLVMPPKVAGPIAPPDAKLPKVPLARFFSLRLTKEEAAAVNLAKGVEGNPEVGINRPAKAGDFAILVAMHIATREIDNWTWQTYWWSFDRPAIPAEIKVPSPFDNYQMTIAYSYLQPKNAGPVICYNPYMETMFGSFSTQPTQSGIQSNCMSCHRAAAWPRVGDSYLANGVVDPKNAKDFNRYFKDRVQTDFLWGIPDAVTAPK